MPFGLQVSAGTKKQSVRGMHLRVPMPLFGALGFLQPISACSIVLLAATPRAPTQSAVAPWIVWHGGPWHCQNDRFVARPVNPSGPELVPPVLIGLPAFSIRYRGSIAHEIPCGLCMTQLTIP